MSLIPYHDLARVSSADDEPQRRRIDMSNHYQQQQGYPGAPGAGMGQPAPGYGASARPAQGDLGQGAGLASHPGYGAYPGAGYYAQGYGIAPTGYAVPRQAQQQSAFLNFGNDRFLKGLLIGAAATYLLTNESVQRTLIKGVVQVWSAVQGGIEEAKERFHDAEAELQHAARSKSQSD